MIYFQVDLRVGIVTYVCVYIIMKWVIEKELGSPTYGLVLLVYRTVLGAPRLISKAYI